MHDEMPSAEVLMQKTRQGDRRAYEELLRQSAKILRPYLSKAVNNPAEIDDVVQDILISVHKALHTYDGERPFRPWLFAIAKFRLHDHLRRIYANKFRHAVDIMDIENSLIDPVTKESPSAELLNDALRSLPSRQADLLRLIHVDGYTTEEAGLRMGMKMSAAKVAAHRAYKVLRKKLSEP